MHSTLRLVPSLSVILGVSACAHGRFIPTDRILGTAGQIDPRSSTAAEDGSWVVLGQMEAKAPPVALPGLHEFAYPPPEGVATTLYLAERPPLAIDGYMVGPQKRHLLVEVDAHYRLFDSLTSTWSELGPVPEWTRDLETRGEVPLSRLDWGCYSDVSANGQTLLYLAFSPNGPRLRVRTLETGDERELPDAPGHLSWARLTPQGDAVVMRTTLEGSPSDAEDDAFMDPDKWPYGVSFVDLRYCLDPYPLAEGATMGTRVVGVDGVEWGTAPRGYLLAKDGLVRTNDGRSWHWWRPRERQESPLLTSCRDPIVLYMSLEHGRVLALCEVEEGDLGFRGRLRVGRFGVSEDLGEVDVDYSYTVADASSRWVALRTREGAQIIDLEQGRRVRTLPGRRVLTLTAARALVFDDRRSPTIRLRYRRAELVDLADGSTIATVSARVRDFTYVSPEGAMTFANKIIDPADGRLLARLPRGVWGLFDGPKVLYDEPNRGRDRGLYPFGPLRWLEYSPSRGD